MAPSTSAHSVTGNIPSSRAAISMRGPSMGQMPLQQMRCLYALSAVSSIMLRSQCGSMPQHAVTIPTGKVHFIAMWRAVNLGAIHSLALKISMPTCHPAMGGRREGSKGMSGNSTGCMPSCMQFYYVKSLVML